MHNVTAATVGKALVALLLGVAVGTVGTLMHRSVQPWGVAVCLLLVAMAGLVARAWNGWPTFAAYGVGVLGSTQLLAREGPGGDVLMPADQAIGWVWILGGVVVLLVVAGLPRRLFVDPAPQPRAVAVGAVDEQPGAALAPDRDPALGTRDDTAP